MNWRRASFIFLIVFTGVFACVGALAFVSQLPGYLFPSPGRPEFNVSNGEIIAFGGFFVGTMSAFFGVVFSWRKDRREAAESALRLRKWNKSFDS